MPVYEFECTNKNCKKITEKITIFSKAQLGIICPECDCRALHIISAANFHTDETRAKRILSKGRKARGKARK
jgi:putative FmdB family regulatory protein